jgi:plastocyanin
MGVRGHRGDEWRVSIMLRRAAMASVLLFLLSTTSAAASTTHIAVTQIHYPPSTSIGLGDTVSWDNTSGVGHTVTSDAPFSQFNLNLSNGTSATRVFKQAGSFPYFCAIHGPASMHGNVHVPMNAVPASGTTAKTFSLHVATIAAPGGFAYVIQRKAPGGSFVLWKTITTKTTTFKTGRAGQWSFRTRVKRNSNSSHSGWSPVLRISVAP